MNRTRHAARHSLVFVAALLACFAAAPAFAHEGTAVIAVENANDRPDGTEYTIRATWTNDGHGAVDATVTATPVDPAGNAGTPVPLEARDDDGRYGGFVSMPSAGLWTIRFSIVEPTGSLEVTRDVIAQATTSTPTTEASTPTTVDRETEPSGLGSPATLLIVAGLMLVTGLMAFLLHRQSKRRSP